VVERGGAPGAWPAFAEGACVVQDEASILVARALAPEAGETVADVCAAPGTKTTHLAQLMGDRGRILAFDPEPRRLGKVVDACRRLGVTSVEPADGTAEALAPSFAGACDRVLVDAPCSNLGVLRRNPEVKWRRRPADLGASAARQAAILAAAACMVRRGGRLVYATCSLEPEENEEVVAAFRTRHPEFRPDPPDAFPVAFGPDGMLRLAPHRHGTDGFTVARLRRA
jgi:16S rRNA (cytosine967-C5)-methyltransferase